MKKLYQILSRRNPSSTVLPCHSGVKRVISRGALLIEIIYPPHRLSLNSLLPVLVLLQKYLQHTLQPLSNLQTMLLSFVTLLKPK